MIDRQKLIDALRCSATPGGGYRRCADCPYCLMEQVDPVLKIPADLILDGIPYRVTCDIDRMAMDAAECWRRMDMQGYNMRLPRGLVVNVFDLPEDFDNMIRKCFAEYTDGTNRDYTYHDRLAFMDLCISLSHGGDKNASDAVTELVCDKVRYAWDDCGELLDKDDVYSADFMAECYDAGRRSQRGCDHYTGDHHIDDEIMRVLERVCRIVMTWEHKDE